MHRGLDAFYAGDPKITEISWKTLVLQWFHCGISPAMSQKDKAKQPPPLREILHAYSVSSAVLHRKHWLSQDIMKNQHQKKKGTFKFRPQSQNQTKQ